MVEEYQQGTGTIQLAKLYGISRETLRATLRRAGLPQHERGLSAEQVDQAVQLYAAGESLARIGKRFDVDAHTVGRRLRENGVAIRRITAR